MAQKDYYVVLGVSPTATTQNIQSAFRTLAKQYHPDRVGAQGTSAFQDIVEAYQILSDPERREVYDRQLRAAEAAEQYGPQPEPLVPEPASPGQPLWTAPRRPEPQSSFPHFMPMPLSFEALQSWMVHHFTGMGVSRGERVETLNVDVILSPDEARRGGLLRLGVPVFAPCARCAGTGQTWGVSCLTCMGEGMIEQEKVVTVRLPPQARHGTILEMPLRGPGRHPVCLRLHVAVAAWG